MVALSKSKVMETESSKGCKRMSVLKMEAAETVIASRLKGAWPEEMDWYRRVSFAAIVSLVSFSRLSPTLRCALIYESIVGQVLALSKSRVAETESLESGQRTDAVVADVARWRPSDCAMWMGAVARDWGECAVQVFWVVDCVWLPAAVKPHG